MKLISAASRLFVATGAFYVALFAALFVATGARLHAQEASAQDGQTSTLSVRSSLVLVPAMVKTKGGAVVFTLTADDFVVTDDGVPQKLRLEEDTDSQPLALVICVETGGTGVGHLDDYRGLGAALEQLVGGIEHKVAVVAFDSKPTLVQAFSSSIDKAATTLGNLDQGDEHASVLDAIGFSVDLLRKQPTKYRRAILLISETLDHGSHRKMLDAMRAISDTNTAIYGVGFSSSRAQISREVGRLSSDKPEPENGCWGKDPDGDPDIEGHPVAKTYDCLAQLAPPLRLARVATILVRNGLRRNVPETVARVTGGEYYTFKDTKTISRALMTISNHVPNRYVLSFQPTSTHTGLHAIEVKLPNHANVTVQARVAYWVDPEPTMPNPASSQN